LKGSVGVPDVVLEVSEGVRDGGVVVVADDAVFEDVVKDRRRGVQGLRDCADVGAGVEFNGNVAG